MANAQVKALREQAARRQSKRNAERIAISRKLMRLMETLDCGWSISRSFHPLPAGMKLCYILKLDPYLDRIVAAEGLAEFIKAAWDYIIDLRRGGNNA